jgi:hypothetical protein
MGTRHLPLSIFATILTLLALGLLTACPGNPLPQQVEAPYSVPADSYYPDESLALETLTPFTSIRYTMDGSIPSGISPLFTEPLMLSGDLTIRAYASRQSNKFESWLDSEEAVLDLVALPTTVGRWRAGLVSVVPEQNRKAITARIRSEYKRVFDTGLNPGLPSVEGVETEGTVVLNWYGWYAQFFEGGNSVLATPTMDSKFHPGASNLAVCVTAGADAERAYMLTGEYLSLWDQIGPGTTGLPIGDVDVETGALDFMNGSFIRSNPEDPSSALEWLPLTIGVWDPFYLQDDVEANGQDWLNAGVAKLDATVREAISQKFIDAYEALRAGTYRSGMDPFNPGRPTSTAKGGLVHPWANAISQTFEGGDSDAMIGPGMPTDRIGGEQAVWGPYSNVTYLFYVAPVIDAASGLYDWENGEFFIVANGFAEEWARVMHHGGGAPGRPIENAHDSLIGKQTFIGGSVSHDVNLGRYVWVAN